MNKEWHQQHPMPLPASLNQRLQWHKEHAQHCACRPIPPGLRAQLRKSTSPEPR